MFKPKFGSNVRYNYALNFTNFYHQICALRFIVCRRQNLDSMFGRLTLNNEVEFSVSTNILALTGSQGIWQSSLVLELPDGKRSCATLIVSI